MSSKKIKLMFLTGTFGVGGKERQVTELIDNLPAEEYEIHLFVKRNEAYYYERIEHKLTSFHSLEKRNFSILDAFAVLKYINLVKPDIVHSWATLTSHFAAFSKLLTKHRFKLINGSIRDAPVVMSLSCKLEAFLYSFYRVVVSNSKAGMKAYRQMGKRNRYVIPNGIDLERIPKITACDSRSRMKWSQDSFIVTMVACMAKRKDYSTLIRAASHCLMHNNNIIFMLVGDGEERSRLMSLVSSIGIDNPTKYIHFLGERSDVEALFIASDVSVLLSAKWHGEGIPNVVVESMACGTPVIASDNGGTKEIVEDGVNGYLVACGDDRDLARKILYLSNNPAIVKGLGSNSKKIICDKYSVSCMVNSYIKLYKTVLMEMSDW